MKIGAMTSASRSAATPAALVEQIKTLESQGLDSVWMPQTFAFDAIDVISAAGFVTSKINFGTAVTPTFPRHPTALAAQAMSAASLTGGRFVLGIGLSHRVVIEGMLNMSFDRPARHMREYLSILMPALGGETVNFVGEQLTARNFKIDLPGVTPPKVAVAALGPVMLQLAGSLADGTITWMVGPKTMEGHIVPSIRKAAADAGRPAPIVAAGFPIALTSDADAAREKIGKALSFYGVLPSYRAMLDREAAGAKPEDIAIVGDEKTLRAAVGRLRDIGVTDFMGSVMNVGDDSVPRTLGFLASLT